MIKCTKGNYIKIAEVLKHNKTALNYTERILFRKIVIDFVDMLEEDNSKFNVDKFLDAVYGKEEKLSEER